MPRDFSGWVTLAEGFPPTLNKEDDAFSLDANESPDAYGVDIGSDGFLKSGSVPVGDTAKINTNSFVNKSWSGTIVVRGMIRVECWSLRLQATMTLTTDRLRARQVS